MRFIPSDFIKKLVLIIFLSMPISSFALIKLNVETLMKNYIDEGLILSTEFNSSKILEEGMLSEFYLGEKLKFDLVVNFENDTLNSGPSDLISVKGTLTYFSSFKQFKFDLGPRKFRLGQKESFFIQLEKGKKLEIYLKSEIKGFYGAN